MNGPSKPSPLTLVSNEKNPIYGYIFRALDKDEIERKKDLVHGDSLGDDQFSFDWVVEDHSELNNNISNIVLMVKNQDEQVTKMNISSES